MKREHSSTNMLRMLNIYKCLWMTSLLKVKGCQRLSSSSTYDRGAWSISVIPGHINPGHIFSIDKRAHTFSVWQWQEPLEQEHGQALLGAPITGWDLPKCMLHMPLNSYIDKCYIAQHILPMYIIYIYIIICRQDWWHLQFACEAYFTEFHSTPLSTKLHQGSWGCIREDKHPVNESFLRLYCARDCSVEGRFCSLRHG